MKMEGPDGVTPLFRKLTRWASSAELVLKELGKRCWNEVVSPGDARHHSHTQLQGSIPGGGGQRTAAAATYPPRHTKKRNLRKRKLFQQS